MSAKYFLWSAKGTRGLTDKSTYVGVEAYLTSSSKSFVALAEIPPATALCILRKTTRSNIYLLISMPTVTSSAIDFMVSTISLGTKIFFLACGNLGPPKGGGVVDTFRITTEAKESTSDCSDSASRSTSSGNPSSEG